MDSVSISKLGGAFLILVIVPALCLAQESNIADHPFFAPLLEGTWTETGQLIVKGEPVDGQSISTSQTVLGGIWIQQDGEAAFGSTRWTWRWMFRLRRSKEGKEIVEGRYLDSNGQSTDYLGEFNENKTSLRFLKPINATTRSLIQITGDRAGRRLIQIGTVDKAGTVSLKYKATGVSDSTPDEESSGR